VESEPMILSVESAHS